MGVYDRRNGGQQEPRVKKQPSKNRKKWKIAARNMKARGAVSDLKTEDRVPNRSNDQYNF